MEYLFLPVHPPAHRLNGTWPYIYIYMSSFIIVVCPRLTAPNGTLQSATKECHHERKVAPQQTTCESKTLGCSQNARQRCCI